MLTDLLLNIPEQHDFQDPTLELDEKRLSSWLAGLPVLSAGESLRMVLRALEPLNEQRLDIGKRLGLLAVYQTTVKRVYDAAAPRALRVQPLSRQQRQDTVDNLERLCLAMADGFKIAIRELHAAPAHKQGKQLLAVAIGGALQQLAAALVHSYRFYRPEPPRVFFELNQLYRLAHHYEVHDNQSRDDNGAGGISLAGIYQACCLLAVTDPFSAEEGRADQHYNTLLHYAPSARVVPGNSWQGVAEGLFYIDMQSDNRPRHCVFLESPVAGDDPYILDARPSLQHMHATLVALSAERRGQRRETGILRALLPELTPQDKRRSARQPAERWIEVVVGLEPVCDWLKKYQSKQPAEAARWKVRDSSDQGYRLAWGESAASLLQVGDLVCVVRDSDDSSPAFQLLMVRWLCDEREQGTQLGVEKLEGSPEPVQLAVVDETNPGRFPALLVSPADGQDSVACLLAPTPVYAENRSLLLCIGQHQLPIRCAERIDGAAGFDCFAFTTDD
jgi:hypothetical protein